MKKVNGMGIFALVLGIVGLILSLSGPLGLLLCLIGLILAIISVVKKTGYVASIVLNAIGLVISFIMTIIVVVVILPLTIGYGFFAANKNKIEIKLNNMATEPAHVYLFYGDGCPHCEDLLEFLEELQEDSEYNFNIYKYEVWYDDDNYELMQRVSDHFDDNATGVPYLVIGNETYIGYRSSMEYSIKKQIREESRNFNENDVVDDYLYDN